MGRLEYLGSPFSPGREGAAVPVAGKAPSVVTLRRDPAGNFPAGVAKNGEICYSVIGRKARKGYHNGGRMPPSKGGGEMVTYEELFTFTMLLVAIIKLVLDVNNRSK